MLNNIAILEKICNFLWLYRKSFEDNFTEREEMLTLSREISRMCDDVYDSSNPKVKRVIDVIRMYEFNRIWNNHIHDDESEAFWLSLMAEKVAKITTPTNTKQRELIHKAKIYMNLCRSKK